jgi:hypothetical protein
MKFANINGSREHFQFLIFIYQIDYARRDKAARRLFHKNFLLLSIHA